MKKNDGSFVLKFIVLFGFILFAAINSIPALRNATATTTATPYANFPLYGPDETPFYHSTGDSNFVPVISFKGVRTWRYNWGQELAPNPILVDGEHLLFAGYVQEPDESPMRNTFAELNTEIVCININSGQVLWQDWIGSPNLVIDENHVVYAPSAGDFSPPGLTAYDAISGKKLWETRFPHDCCDVDTFYPVGSELYVTTHLGHGYYSSYILGRETGEIKQSFEGEERYQWSDGVTSGEIILKRHYYGYGPVKAFRIDNGSQLWVSYEPVVSNIAVDDSIAYFVTMNAQLLAINIQTGETLSRLSFTPEFDPNLDYYDPEYKTTFDFLNEAPTVAADNNYVAVYFEDKKQLSVFRFIGER